MKNCWLLICFAASAWSLVETTADQSKVAAEYFVAPSGSQANDGTPTSPWPSVSVALEKVGGGQVITLLPGVYTEPIVVDSSGNATAPTVIRSQDKWAAIIRSPGAHGVYTSDGVTNVVIDGLQVEQAGIDGIKVGSHVTVRNCWIHHSARQGVSAHRTRQTYVEFNLIEHNGTDPAFDHGIYISGTNNVIRGNVIRWNKTYGCQIYYDLPDSSAECQFYHNLVYGNKNALTVWSPTRQTNYVYQNTLIAENYVVIADMGVLCLTNNILSGPLPNRILSAEEGAIVRSDYNLMTTRPKRRGLHDFVAANPGFVNCAAGLFWLRADSPARGRGYANLKLPISFFGAGADQSRDIGAFSYTVQRARDRRLLDRSTLPPDYWAPTP